MPRSPVSVAHHCVKVDELLVAQVVKSPSRSSAAQNSGRTNGASLFEFAPRPRFTLGLNPSPAVACGGLKTARSSAVVPGIITRSTHQQGRNLKMLGLLQYYPLPRVSFASRILQVPVRTFLNPGWGKRLPLACESCEPGSNYRVSMHILDPFLGCGTSAAATRYVAPGASTQKRGAAAAGENNADGFVGLGGVDGADRDDLTGVLADADVERMKEENLRELHVGEEARATMASDLRPIERRHYLHRRLAVCFEPDARYYPNVSILVGYATFHTSIADTQAFVLGIIFLIVLLPICCVVSMVLHRQKCINLARRHKSVRFWLERQRLQQELIAVRDMRDEMEQAGSPRNGGATGGGGQE
eukprot:g4702.t1